MNNEELLNENIKLNAIIDGYQPKMQALKDERDKYYQQTLDDEITLNELYQTLQEIKAIAEDAYENDSEYQATGVYNEIIQKITKAEEE